jgi:hypothetical protein
MQQLKYKYQLENLALVLILSFLVIFIACRHDTTRRTPPRAVKGVLDLTDWDFKKNGSVDLSGEYEFYWSQHLSPSDFLKTPPPEKTGFINVPGYWKDDTFNGKRFPGKGYVTYRLNIRLNEQKESLALRSLEISTAYNIYVNGQKVGALGIPGNNLETTVPRHFPQIINFELKTNQMEIIFHVSNFHHRRGGLWEIIQLGREKDIRKAEQKKLSFDLFLCGSILIMTLYHLGLFIVRKKDRSSLYFSIFCFLIALRLLTTGGRYLVLLFPNISYEVMVKLEYLSFYLAFPAFALFMQSIFQKFSKRILHLIALLGIAFSCIVLFTPARFFSHTLNVYEITTFISLIYGLYVIFASLTKMRIEAFVFLLGFSILLITVINDMLHVERLIQTGFFVPFGLFAFILSQAFLLSYRFSQNDTPEYRGRLLRGRSGRQPDVLQ